MKKNWNYNGKEYTMSKLSGYGQYTINGYNCTDSEIWDNVDDEDQPEKQEAAMKAAERFIERIDPTDAVLLDAEGNVIARHE